MISKASRSWNKYVVLIRSWANIKAFIFLNVQPCPSWSKTACCCSGEKSYEVSERTKAFVYSIGKISWRLTSSIWSHKFQKQLTMIVEATCHISNSAVCVIVVQEIRNFKSFHHGAFNCSINFSGIVIKVFIMMKFHCEFVYEWLKSIISIRKIRENKLSIYRNCADVNVASKS